MKVKASFHAQCYNYRTRKELGACQSQKVSGGVVGWGVARLVSAHLEEAEMLQHSSGLSDAVLSVSDPRGLKLIPGPASHGFPAHRWVPQLLSIPATCEEAVPVAGKTYKTSENGSLFLQRSNRQRISAHSSHQLCFYS